MHDGPRARKRPLYREALGVAHAVADTGLGLVALG